MSQETQEWLNTMTLIGFTEVRGNAWHYAATYQGDEPNHYVGPVPVEDVRRRLLNWTAVEVPIGIETPLGWVTVEGRKAIARSDTYDVLGVFKDGYQPHQYDQWLVRNVETILDDNVQIGQAGLLRNGAQAWVSVEMPENMRTQSGVEFRPQLLATTSFDGSTATTYKLTSTIVVCDNTREAALRGSGEQFKLKHTRYSSLKIGDARQALGIMFEAADDLSREIDTLMAQPVTIGQYRAIVDAMAPLPVGPDGKVLDKGRGLTQALNKRDALLNLYANDLRVAPYAGTAFGVAQAFSTYNQHVGVIRGASRVQRNAGNALGNIVRDQDAEVIATMEAVLANV